MTKKTSETFVLAAAVVGSLVLVNVLAVGLFWRLDLTQDKRFTLSDATKETLASLEDPVTVRAYFSAELPPPFSSTARYVRDLLEEYYAHADGKLRYEFIDPIAEETDEDKEKKKDVKQDIFGRAVREPTSVEKELARLQIPPVQVRVNEDDKIEVKRAYLGIALQYRDETEVIPVVQTTDGLEYDLTAAIRKMSRAKDPKVAVLTGHDGPTPREGLQQLAGLVGQLYEVTTVDTSAEAKIPDDVDAILVVGPETAYSAAEQRAIDQFVMSGRAAAFLLGSVDPDLQQLQANPTDHGLSDLLATWGVRIGEGLVLDAECATLSVTQQRGFLRIAQPVRYPFVPVPKRLDPDHPLTRGLSQVSFPFMSPLEVAVPEGAGFGVEPLVTTSEESWIQSPPYDLNPLQEWTRDRVTAEGSKTIMVAVSGALPSHFVRAAPESSAAPEEGLAQAESARVLVAGGHAFVQDAYLAPGNQALVLNLLDWLVQDEALLAVRSRGLGAAPLEPVSDATRAWVKYGNILGLPLLFAGFGLLRRQRREARRKTAVL